MNEIEEPYPPAEGNTLTLRQNASDEEELWLAYLDGDLKRKFLKEMVGTLPDPVQDRVVALKNLQVKQMEALEQFTKELLELEKDFYEKCKPLLEERAAIISGEIEPPEQEPKFKELKENDDEEDVEFDKEDFSGCFDEIKAIPPDAKGVPGFWLTVFKCVESLSDLITARDEDALKKLKDVKCVFEEEKTFTIEFHFAENDYFTNSVLSKKYFLKTELADYTECTWDYEGEEIYKCTGCEIDWKPGKNLLHKVDTDDKEDDSDVDSFFMFFNPPIQSEDNDDDEIEDQLITDYEIGGFLRDSIIPKAVLFFTGDLVEEDECDEYESSEDDESSSDEEESSDDDQSSDEDQSSHEHESSKEPEDESEE